MSEFKERIHEGRKMTRILDAEDLEAIEPLRALIEAIDKDQDVALLGALMDVEAVRKHLRSKYYDRPVELRS